MSEIVHNAKVVAVGNNDITLRITRSEACGGCALKEACGQTTKNYDIIVKTDNPDKYKKGQSVEVAISQKQMIYASFLGYTLPLLIILSTLFISYIITKDEEISALLSLSVLPVYYIVLWRFHKRFQKALQIRLL